MKRCTTEKSSITPIMITSKDSPRQALPAAYAAAWFLGVLFFDLLRRLAASNGSFVSTLQLSGLVACLGFLTHSLVDFNLHIPANALLFFHHGQPGYGRNSSIHAPAFRIGANPPETSKSLMDLVLLTV